MNKFLNVVFALALVFTVGQSLESSSLFQSKMATSRFGGLKAIQDIESSKFGRQLLDTIALQMKNETPLQDIASLLAEIRADLVAQQKADDNLQNERRIDCETSISDFERRIQVATDNIATAVQTISQLRAQITDFNLLVTNYETQVQLVDRHLTTCHTDRQTDAIEFEARSVRTQQTVEALQMIIPKLKSLAPSTAATALAQLSKIGKSNPIASFMEVASTIDPERLDVVVEKMQQLLDSLEASLVEDSDNEAAAIQQFHGLVNDLESTQTMISTALTTTRSNLEQAESKLASQERFLEEQQAEEQASREGLAAKKEQCKLWAASYASTKDARTAERLVVEKVQQILAERLSSMSEYLRERVDN